MRNKKVNDKYLRYRYILSGRELFRENDTARKLSGNTGSDYNKDGNNVGDGGVAIMHKTLATLGQDFFRDADPHYIHEDLKPGIFL